MTPPQAETQHEASVVIVHEQLTQTLGSQMASTSCHRTGCHSEVFDWPDFCSWCLWFLLIGAWSEDYVLCVLSADWRSRSRQWTEPERMGMRCRSAQSESNLTCLLTSLQSYQGLQGHHPFQFPLCAPLHLPLPLWSHPGCWALSGNWVCDWTGGWRVMESRNFPHGLSEERRVGRKHTKGKGGEEGEERCNEGECRSEG